MITAFRWNSRVCQPGLRLAKRVAEHVVRDSARIIGCGPRCPARHSFIGRAEGYLYGWRSQRLFASIVSGRNSQNAKAAEFARQSGQFRNDPDQAFTQVLHADSLPVGSLAQNRPIPLNGPEMVRVAPPNPKEARFGAALLPSPGAGVPL